eukprot:10349103-Heterocapsa_arctica.AAC.1
MDGDSDFEEEEPENELLDQQLMEEQEGHFGMFAQRQAKGKGNRIKGSIWMEENGEEAQEDAGMGDNLHAEEPSGE